MSDAEKLCVKKSPGDGVIVTHDNTAPVPLFVRSRYRYGIGFDIADLLQDDSEVLSIVGGEGALNIFPQDVSRIFSICCIPHFIYDAYCLMEQTGAFAV